MRDSCNVFKRVWKSRVSVVRVDTRAVTVVSCVVASESCDDRVEIWAHAGTEEGTCGNSVNKRACMRVRYDQSSPVRRVSRQLFVNGAHAAARDELVLGARKSGP